MTPHKKQGRMAFLTLFALIGMLAGCAQTEQDLADQQDASAEDDRQDDGDATTGQEDEPVTLRLVTAWPESDQFTNAALDDFIEAVDRHSGGSVTIKVAGGPEVVSPFDLASSARDGAVDIAWLSTSYYLADLPEAAVFGYSELDAETERESGAFDRIDEIHREELNVTVLGRASYGIGYAIYTTEPIAETSDFAGMRIRAAPIYVQFIESLGAEPVVIPGGEIYTAVERGVVEGLTWMELGTTALSLEELVSYKVLPAYWGVDIITIMNLDSWDRLSEAQQQAIDAAAREIEGLTPQLYEKLIAEEDEALRAAGVEIVELDDAETYLELSREAAWEWLYENAEQGNAEELEELYREQ